MATTYLTLTNRVLRELNETELTSSTFSSSRGIQTAVKDFVNKGIHDIYNETGEIPLLYSRTSQNLFVGDNTGGIESDVELDDRVVSLSRWDIKSNGEIELFRRADSQDSWIFTSPVSREIEEKSNFYLGRMGCDNALAWIFHDGGMKLSNPALQIITRHLHLVQHRTYHNYGSLLDDPKKGLNYTKVYITDDWKVSRVGKNCPEWELL